MKIGKRTKDAIYIFALFVLTIIFFEQMIFHNKILLLRDLYCDYIPWRTFARESIRSGTMPLWNPYSSLGQPFIAFPQTAVFYPLNLMFYALPIITALRWFIVLHIFLAGVFMYILMKHWNVSRIAAFVSAIIFMFNGMIISRLEFLTIVSTLVWIPLLFYLLDIAIKKNSLWSGVLTGIVLSVQLLAGHPQTFYYAYLSLGLYWIVRITIQGFTTRDIKSITKPFMVLPLATIIAISLSMIQLLPTFELLRLSIRAENFNAQAFGSSLHPFHLFTFLIPYLFGTPGYANEFWGLTIFEFWAGSFYVGIFTLIICLIPIRIFVFHKRFDISGIGSTSKDTLNSFKTLTTFFFALVIVMIILASGMYTPVYHFFYTYFPLFNKFRWPSRIMELAVFSLSIIAGIGVHYFILVTHSLKNTSENGIRKCLYLVFKILVIADITLITIFLFCHFVPEKVLPLITEYINTVHFEDIPTTLEARYSHMLKEYLITLIFLNAGILVFFMGIIRKTNYQVLKLLIALIIIVDLFVMFKDLNYYSNTDVYEAKPDVIKFLESDKDIYRAGTVYNEPQQYIYGLKDKSDFLWTKAVLAGETSLPNHISKLVGGGELKIGYYIDFMDFLSKNVHSSTIGNNFLKLFNTKYIIKGCDTFDILFRGGDRNVSITKIDKFLPRTFVVGKATTITSKTEMFRKLFSENFDPFREIVIEDQVKDVGNLSFEKKEINYEIKTIGYSSNKVKVLTELEHNGFLVLSDTFYPGWKAFVDGKETPIYKTDYILRSVFLEKGTHNVEFVYDPISFKIGYIITLSTTFVLIILGILKYRNSTVKTVPNGKVCP